MKLLQTKLTFPIVHCVYQQWHWISIAALVRSICLLISCIGKVVFERSQNFRWMKVFHRRVFDANDWKSTFFTRRVTLSQFCGPKTHVWHPNADQAVLPETLVAFNFKPKVFWFVHKILVKDSNKFVHHKNSARSTCLKVLHITRTEEKN